MTAETVTVNYGSSWNQDNIEANETEAKHENFYISEIVALSTYIKMYQDNVHELVREKARNFVCDACPNSFRKNHQLTQHQQRVHSTTRKFTCLVCSKGWLSKGELVTHIKCHTKEKKKIQNNHMCEICGQVFRKLSKKKIHMVTHSQLFKNLRIDSHVILSEDGTKIKCLDCGREFKMKAHMKAHIAQVHYQLQNKENLDNFEISDIVKRVETSDCYKKTGQPDPKKVMCQECGKYYFSKHLKEHVRNVHGSRSENLPVQSEEFINFLTELNVEFSGQQLVLVLDFVKDLKERSSTDQLQKIIEEGINVSYKKVFENLGVLQTEYLNPGEATPKVEVDKKESNEKEKIKNKKVQEDLVKKENVKTENVKKEPYPEDANIDLEESNIGNRLIEGTETLITAITKDESKYDTHEFNKGTNFGQKKRRTNKLELSNKLNLEGETIAKKLQKKKVQHIHMCPICKKTFTKMSKKKIHMMKHTQLFKNFSIENKATWSRDKTTLSCTDCGREFKGIFKVGNMKAHIAQVHYQLHNFENMDTLNICDIDIKVETSDISKQNTSLPANKEDIFFCEICLDKFSHSEFLEKHILVKHKGLGYNCDSCDHSNNSLEGLLKHQSSKHNVKEENIEVNEERDPQIKQAIQCEVCSKQFARNEGLRRHKYFKHEGLGYNCDKCDHAARSPLGLLKHQCSTHGVSSEHIPDDVLSSSFQCKDCGKFYNSKSVLRRHALVHTGERPFSCNKCDKRFRQKSTLEGHRGIHI